jgi:L-lactate dehydrogenase
MEKFMAESSKAQMPPPLKVAVVGVGNVGATFAYALLLNGLASEIVLIDANRAKAEGEAMDLNHTVPFVHPTRIWAGDFSDCEGASVIVLAAGVGSKPGETRLDLVHRNAAVWREIVPKVVQHNRSGILVIATNPVDVLTYLTCRISGLPHRQVIGSGTILDTARFRYLLSQHFEVDARSVHAFIVGEHGDSEVPVWSLANIAGMRLQEFCSAHGCTYDQKVMDEIFQQTRDAAYHIIERKHATYYAVAAGLLRITRAILRDQNTVLSVSSLIQDYYGLSDVCFSLPTIVNRSGVAKVLRIQLDSTEVGKLRHSAKVLTATVSKVGI